MSEDWDALLPQFLVRMMNAENALEYHKTVAEMVAHTQDTHCFVNSEVLNDFYGISPPPLSVRWIENNVVVTKVIDDSTVIKSGLVPGDIVLKIDGRDVKDRMNELAPYIAASTPQALMWRTMYPLLNGKEGSSVMLVVKDGEGQIRNFSLSRMSRYAAELLSTTGDPIRLINDNIGYVDLSRLPTSRVDEMFDKFKNTRGFIMDMRGYPQGTAWLIAPRLTEKDQPVAAQFRRNLVTADNISSYYFEQRLPYTDKWRYSGETVMLIDERAISQSEHSGLFYRTANSTKFIGSATNGANGDVTFFWVPGGIRVSFSGHDIRHADGTQLQRVGLQPDIEVTPTIAGIRAGRDEVLENAIEYLSQ
jgi:C-terminal processing protease CtpA/Prc